MTPAAPPRRSAPTRESLTTIARDGSRVFLHPADARGRFTLARRIAATLLIAIYVLLPWIPVNGAPAVFFDVGSLRFHFFGLTLAAQDLWLAFFLITGLGFSLFYVTALFGRLWCGWACPQTVFLEHVFRRIERWCEGDATRRRRLDEAPWDAAKTLRRGGKHVLYVLAALVIAHVFLSYFVSVPRVLAMAAHSPLEHWGVFLFIVTAAAALYFNFAWFREQLCIVICPYGRLQSALIDDHTLSIGYDARRGEPRGRLGAGASGDCVDCLRCVQVCPTGIDIRQGLQMECIGCAACIDACDDVMTKLGRPRGLVRYDSHQGLAGLKTRLLRPRVFIYSTLLLIGLTAASISVSRYQPATMTTVRMPGAAYYVDEAYVRNQLLVRVINKSAAPETFALRVATDDAVAAAALRWSGWEEPVTIPAHAEEVRPLVIQLPRQQYRGRFPYTIHVERADGRAVLDRSLEFAGPDPRLFHAPHAASAP